MKSFYIENNIELGIDEAGRGCLLGPVCIGSVIMGDICADANTIISFNVNSSGNIVLTMPMTDFPSNDFELLPSNQSLFSGNNCTNLWYEFTLFAAG